MTNNELAEILRLHALAMRNDPAGVRANLSRANLSGANLSGAYLSGADLSRADLSRADFSGAYLSRADFSGANLSGAYLSGANLSRANLSRANLSGAYLSGANLSRAYLSGANLILIGQDIRGYLFWATDDDGYITIRAGCRWFTGITAARVHWQNRHLGDPVLHADCLSLVQRCETMATARGWKLEPGREEQP